ncbi:Anaerobic sulfite reductase subunit B [Moorella thermoacetica]|uniref:anaerobic sulfite reductase subunit AsrB n=1 Tax=Neomoorella thermoacetica TaxID=1525 RepID=UPI0030CF688A
MIANQIANPYLPAPAQVLAIQPQTGVDYTFRLATDIEPAWGQFVEISLPGVGEAPISVSDAGPGYIELTIRRVGKVTTALHQLKPGDTVYLRGPYGSGFPRDEFAGHQLVVAAGGTGVAPVKGLINYYAGHPGELAGLNLLLGFKTPADILFRTDIERWQGLFPTILTVDQGQASWSGKVGLVTEFVKEIPLKNDARIIVVGPPLMIKFTVAEFIKCQIKPEQIWISLERRMHCGLGKCGHCKINDVYVCLEGPVFNYSRARDLVD